MKLFSNIIGTGNDIIILHGLYGSSDNWFSIGKMLAANNFKVHLLDLRNHGKSPHSNIHNYEAMSEDIKEYIKSKNLESTFILGHSMGGKVAMLFALRYPTLLKKMIVADIAPKNYQQNNEGHKDILKAIKQLDLTKFKNRQEVELLLKQELKSDKITQLIMKNLYRNENKIFQWRINVDVLTENLEKITGGFGNIKSMHSTIPTLFLKGEHSHYLSLDDDFLIKKFFSKSEITTIPNAGHWLHAEQTELTFKTIMFFIGE